MVEQDSVQSVPSLLGDAAINAQPDLVDGNVDAQGPASGEAQGEHEGGDGGRGGDDDDDVDDDNDGSDEDDPVETLIAGRARRQTAGNRMSTLLDQEAEDDLTLLFAEEGEDNEFEDPDAAEVSDFDDDSSSDEEDRGPLAGDDDLEGERQLQKEERAEKRAQKRKVDKTFMLPNKVRKRVKIDESSAAPGTPSSTVAATKPRKKSERVSWIPTEHDGPVRTSSRTLSVQNKEKTIASMKESEGRRAQQIKSMEQAQKRKAAEKAKPMTQEERLAEAARTERQNSKSLNRWEEMEKDRMSRQQARLDALQQRKLEGPVIRWHSGPVDWVNGKMTTVGEKTQIEEMPDVQVQDNVNQQKEESRATIDPPRNRGAEGEVETMPLLDDRGPEKTNGSMQNEDHGCGPPSSEKLHAHQAAQSTPEQDSGDLNHDVTEAVSHSELQHLILVKDGSVQEEIREDAGPESVLAQEAPLSKDSNSEELLDGISFYTSLSEKPSDQKTLEGTSVANAGGTIASPKTASTGHGNKANVHEASPDINAHATVNTIDSQSSSMLADPGPPPLPDGRALRNTVSILNLANPSNRDKDISRRILFNWRTSDCYAHTAIAVKSARIYQSHQNHQALCAITSLPAKYRDPLTGLPYATAEAYATIRRVVEGRCRWSNLLGSWVGVDIGGTTGHGIVARGVPEGFVKAKPGTIGASVPAPIEASNAAGKAADATGLGADAAQTATPATKKGHIATQEEDQDLDGPRRTRGRAASRATKPAITK